MGIGHILDNIIPYLAIYKTKQMPEMWWSYAVAL